MYGWLLLVFVVLLSGVLAYWGDVVGRKLGKKRLTIGRLRPRHTAAVMTALFGMLGAVLAIAALLWISEPVKSMLFEGDKLKSELESMKLEQKKLRGDVAQGKAEVAESKKEVQVQQAKVKAEEKKVEMAQKDVAGLRELAASLKSQASRVRSQLSAVKSQLAGLRRELVRVKEEKTRVDFAKEYANKELNKINERNLKLENEIREKEAKANSRIKELQTKIDDLNGSFTLLQDQFEKQAKQNKADIDSLQADVDRAKQALGEAQQELFAARAEAAKLGSTTTISRFQPLIFSKDDELARISVRTRLNAAEARSNLLALFEQASVVARASGAKPSVAGGPEAVLPEMRDKAAHVISPEAQLQTLVQSLSNIDHELVILASSIFNSFKGEPVGLRIRILANPVVYKQGETIGETKIDGQVSQDQVVQALTLYLQEHLAPKAVKDGMIPALGQANPLGEIKQEALFKLVADIKARPFTTRVRFIAAQETRAGDRLQMEFRLP